MSEVLLAIGTGKGLFVARSRDGRRSWTLDGPQFVGDSIYAIGIDTRRSTPRLLVGAQSEHWGPSVFRSDDLGQTWQEPERGAVRFPAEADAALVRVWQLQPGPADQPDLVWAGTEPAALFRSDDGGVTFDLVDGLWDHPHRPQWQPGGGGLCLHTVVAHPTDPGRVLVAVSAGGVYRTEDGGKSWEAANSGLEVEFLPDPRPEFGQCVHKVSMNAAQPDQLFLQNHQNKGGVYRSDDGGRSWVSIATGLPASFGFPIAAHPRRSATAYVFPLVADAGRLPPDGRCRVYRTSDAGSSWEALTAGLPQHGFHSVVLRDGLTVDDADPIGIYFGTRSGEVYASSDEGDSWSAVAQHLPDVRCVRAAVVG
jgi:photosystem II stability/assembly factor-like uncharacterized protein